jgi:hypothetical protein
VRPTTPQARFPFSLLNVLACPEFCSLTDMHQRTEWMRARDIHRAPTAVLVREARKYLASKDSRQ